MAEGAPTKVAIVALSPLALRSDRPPALDALAPPDVVVRDDVPIAFRGDPTERYGTVPGPEIVMDEEIATAGMLDDAGPEQLVAVSPTLHGASPSVPRVEEPSRERGLFRRIRDSEVGRAVTGPSTPRRYESTLRLEKVPPRTSRALLLAGAGALALVVVAIAMLVRQWESIALQPSSQAETATSDVAASDTATSHTATSDTASPSGVSD